MISTGKHHIKQTFIKTFSCSWFFAEIPATIINHCPRWQMKENKYKDKPGMRLYVQHPSCQYKFHSTSLSLMKTLKGGKRVRKWPDKIRPPFFCTHTNHSQLERDRGPLMAKWLLFFPSMMLITWCHRCHCSHGNLLLSYSVKASKEMCICISIYTHMLLRQLKANPQWGIWKKKCHFTSQNNSSNK